MVLKLSKNTLIYIEKIKLLIFDYLEFQIVHYVKVRNVVKILQ